jgi:hypothetical protein
VKSRGLRRTGVSSPRLTLESMACTEQSKYAAALRIRARRAFLPWKAVSRHKPGERRAALADRRRGTLHGLGIFVGGEPFGQLREPDESPSGRSRM